MRDNLEEVKLIEEIPQGIKLAKEFDRERWNPKTELGKKVKLGEIKTIEEAIQSGKKILESEIIDSLVSNLESEIISVGQSKGKFGGGKRSIWRQTQKKTSEGNKPKFATLIAVGNRNVPFPQTVSPHVFRGHSVLLRVDSDGCIRAPRRLPQ